MKILIDEEKRIVAYARLGDLENGIEVEDFKFEHDCGDYVYRDNEIIYEPKIKGMEELINAIKEAKREELKRVRDEKVEADIEIHNAIFQVRKQDLENFYDVKLAVELKEKQATDKREWVLADNSIREFTYEQIITVLKARGNRKDEIYKQFKELAIRLHIAKTVEEIEAIKWE